MNKYGLSRHIPKDIARIIRKEAGFGCVVCGIGIIEYEHIDPEFHEAKVHDPAKMTLLCPGCHSKVTRGIWSKEKVLQAKNNPAALKAGFSNEWYDFSNRMIPDINFAGSRGINCRIPIMFQGVPIIRISPPIEHGSPFLLSAIFYDLKGKISLEIIENEWRAYTDNWDVTVEGPYLTVKNDEGVVVLKIKSVPPIGIHIEKIEMKLNGVHISGNVDELTVKTPEGGCIKMVNCIGSGGDVGISL